MWGCLNESRRPYLPTVRYSDHVQGECDLRATYHYRTDEHTKVHLSEVLPMTETKTIECVEGFEEVCAKCGGDVEWTDCWNCGGNGIDGHECGEDTCCCLDPEDNVRCNTCEGKGSWATCPGCDK